MSNYRPISLLSTVGKALEKIVHKHMFNFFHENQVLTALQSGFVPGDSTVNQLTDLYNTFCHALDEGKEVRAVFCDISKAFDRVWHKGLLYKLSSVGISGSLLQWFTDYLNNRQQRVVLPGTASNWTSLFRQVFLKVLSLVMPPTLKKWGSYWFRLVRACVRPSVKK